MMTKRQSFYRSRTWESFVKTLRLERADEQGLLICEHCGQPILKAYDCIAHHKIELTEDNVGDATIALNPDNIMLIHFRCHNEIHKRFGFGGGGGRQKQSVYIVYGSPCAGKSTWVDSVSESGDIILDIDRLWAAVRSGGCGQYDKPDGLKANVFALRDCLIDMIRVRRGRWRSAYIIGGYPLDGERDRLADLVGADRVIFIDTPKEICLERARQKDERWVEYVETWWDRYSPLKSNF